MTPSFDASVAVHVVDDEAPLRSSLGFLLKSHGLKVCTYTSGPEFLEAFSKEPLRGVILLDVRMEPMSGLQVHAALRQLGCTLPVLFLSGHGDIPMAVEAVHNGALDFIEKPFKADDLLSRLHRALENEAQAQTQYSDQQALRERLGQLTEREQDIMVRVAAGKLNKVIADELNISMRTVEVHRARVFSKMGVRSSAELATLLARQNDH